MKPPLLFFSPQQASPLVQEKEAFPLVRAFYLLSLTPISGANVDLGALAKDLMGSSLVFSPIFEVFLVCTTKGRFYWHFPT